MYKFITDIQKPIVFSLSEISNWGLTKTGIAEYRKKTGADGTGIKIAVLDSGIDNQHIDLINSVVARVDFTSGGNLNGHGTFIAGIISADENGIGCIGVAPKADLYDVRVVDTNGLSDWRIIDEGLRYAISLNPHIINCSFGCAQNPPQTTINLIHSALANGIIITAAAGNSGCSHLDYPAALAGVIAVGSLDEDGERSDFSQYGENLCLDAPGKDLYSTWLDGGYIKGSGTSYASPFVAGIIALVLQHQPNISNEALLRLVKSIVEVENG